MPERSYLVLGASGGIAAATARRLAGLGGYLVLASRTPDAVGALAAETRAETIACDATRLEQVEAAVSRTAELGSLAGVVNCAGSLLLKPAHLTSEAEWNETISINLTSAFFTVRAAARVMMREGGSIVLVSSAAARMGLANHEAVAAAKAGVTGLGLAAAASYAPRGIRVNVVAPGLVRTPMTAKLFSNQASLEASEALHALGRTGEADEVASAIAWLLEPAQSWVTGQVLGVDGGLATLRSQPRRASR